MSGKKVNHFIHFHYSGKQCRILAKFCSNNAASITANKMVTPKNRSVHYRQPERHVTVKVYVCANIKHTQSLKNVFHVLECKLENVDATA